MLRKKQLTQLTNNLNRTKKEINAKVTVQYIQEQQRLIQKSQNSDDQHKLLNSTQDDLEIENVEYLEDNPNLEEYIDEHSEKDDFEDNFYPNAIHCLLDLYKTKYENLNAEGEEIKVSNIWRDIAKNMQESFFEFNERQVQQKYLLLREQYFALQTKDDIDNFDYFEQLHNIYKDPNKEDIIKGLVAEAERKSIYYKDEILLNSSLLENNRNNHVHDFKSDEIVHKEHEFIDMVEKELQAMEDGSIHVKRSEQHLHDENLHLNDDDKLCYNDCNAENKEPRLVITTQNLKKSPPNNLDTPHTNSDIPAKKRPKIEEYFKVNESVQKSCSAGSSIDYSLFHYNQHQERRHREKMSMLEKYLQVQERALEQQQQILQELLKRLPS